jgi:hypothetical protein
MGITREDEGRLVHLDTIFYEAFRQIKKRAEEISDMNLKTAAAEILEEFILLHSQKKCSFIP